LEEAQLGSWFVLLLRWDEMRNYSAAHSVTWPVAETRARALEEFARVYRAHGLDQGVLGPASAVLTYGQDWGMNEHTTPPQLGCFAENVMGNGTCKVV